MTNMTNVILDECINSEYITYGCDPQGFYTYVSIVLVLILMAGMMAGLTMGLLSIDRLNMTILTMEGSDDQKTKATSILSVLINRHLLLVTLLLVNAGANEALPVFLNKLVTESSAVLISVTCVLIFGEILPSAIFTGSNQLSIAAFCVPFVKILIALTAPIAYPISLVLDFVLGSEGHELMRFKRRELKALVALQREKVLSSPAASVIRSKNDTNLHLDEVTVIHGALDLTTKMAMHVMIPMQDVYMLEESEKLDGNLMADIMASGHSRIPIYRKEKCNIIGVIIVKKLIVLDPDDARPISDLALRIPLCVDPYYTCYGLLNEFQRGKSHLAFVSEQSEVVNAAWEAGSDLKDVVFQGIVTLEDVVEELIQEEIEDESDHAAVMSNCLEVLDPSFRKQKLREAGLRRAYTKLKTLAAVIRRKRPRQHRPVISPTTATSRSVRAAAINSSRIFSGGSKNCSNNSEERISLLVKK